MSAAQDQLLSSQELGDEIAACQLELDGVVQALVHLRINQTEFVEITQATGTAETRGARPASPSP